MPMTIKFNALQLEANIQQITERAVKGMSEKMRKTAIKIRDLARDYAPEKTGLLEENIDYETIKQGGRNSYVVYINLDAVRKEGEGVLGDYALIMEQQLHPYGRQRGARRFKLGPGSVAKAASGKKVGGRFLARAVKEGTSTLVADLAAEVRRVTNSNRTIPMDYQIAMEADE